MYVNSLFQYTFTF